MADPHARSHDASLVELHSQILSVSFCGGILRRSFRTQSDHLSTLLLVRDHVLNMARKAKTPSDQLGFAMPLSKGMAGPSPPSTSLGASHAPESTADLDFGSGGSMVSSVALEAGETEQLDLDSFDDYDDTAIVDDVPRIRLADPPRDAPTVIVESVGDHYEVSRLRDNGSTVACVMWTRTELEELRRRIDAALEI
jgi:hypothetical protein